MSKTGRRPGKYVPGSLQYGRQAGGQQWKKRLQQDYGRLLFVCRSLLLGGAEIFTM